MHLRSTIISGLLFFLIGQTPQDTIRQHYEAAEAARIAGDLNTSESEYTLILAEGYQQLGRIYSTRAEYAPAITSLELAQKYRPHSVSLLVDLAIANFGAEQFHAALVAANQAISLDSNNAGAHQMAGKTYFMLGDVAKSITELETANRLAPDDIDVTYTLGIAYLRNRQPAEARELYGALTQRLGEQPQLHIVIGRAYRQSGLLADAAQEFKKAIALDPRYPRAHYYLGMTYLLDEGQSKIGEALEEFRNEVSANPDEFLGNYYLGVVYNFQRQWALALTFLQKAVTAQPNNPDAYFQLGQAYQELNLHEQAIDALRKAIAYNPNLAHNKSQVTTAHHRLAQSLIKLGQTEEGRKELQVAADLKAQAFKLEQKSQGAESASDQPLPLDTNIEQFGIRAADQQKSEVVQLDEKTREELKDSEAYYQKVIGRAHNNIGLLRAERQDVVGAADQFALAAKWDPQQQGVSYNLGLAYFKSQSYEKAIRPLETELKMNPANRPARALLGLSWFRLGDYVKASESLAGVIDQQTSDANLYYHLAASLIKQGKSAAADGVMTQLKKVYGDDSPNLHLLIAERDYSLGLRSQALAELVQPSLVKATTPLLHYYSALLYLNLKKPNEAIREFESELALNPNDIESRYALGEALINVKNLERGLTVLREVIQARPNHVAAHRVLGKALLQSGDQAGAIQNFEQASQLDPDDADVQYELGRAYILAGRKAEGKTHLDLSERLRRSRSQVPGKN